METVEEPNASGEEPRNPARPRLSAPAIAALIVCVLIVAGIWRIFAWDVSVYRGDGIDPKYPPDTLTRYAPARAREFVQMSKTNSLFGQEVWTQFRFDDPAQFEAYRRRVESEPGFKTDALMQPVKPGYPPRRLDGFWELDKIAGGTRTTWVGGAVMQWFFDPARLRVYNLYASY